ncbi:hypothetical protein N7540_011216 [Penicillium herquei]|nr:hypothetical protein N7540_011216 [Penicillium herquei]
MHLPSFISSPFLGLWLLASLFPLLTAANQHGHSNAHARHEAARSASSVFSTSSASSYPTGSSTEPEPLVRRSETGLTQLFNISDITTFFSSDCANALAGSLNCSSIIAASSALYSWGGMTIDNLTDLCTEYCSESIANFRTDVLEACANDVYTDEPVNATGYVYGTGVLNDIYNVDGVSVEPIALVDYYFLGYNMTCSQDNSDPPNFCYILTGNNTNSTEVDPCDNCGLGLMRMQLEDARMYNDELASDYSASVSSCGITVPPVTTPTPVFLTDTNTIVANYSATATCTGSYIPIPTGESCDDFAEANSISTDQLLMQNGLVAGCVNWPGNLTTLCVQNTCEPYLVQQNDTCLSVVAANNMTITQLFSWNPTIDPICANWDTQIGHVICLSNPLGYVSPSVTANVSAAITAASVPTDAMTGSNTDCAQWYEVSPGDYCAMLTMKFAIALSDFYFLNPEVNSNCSNLWSNQSYCVEAVGDISTYPGYLPTTATPTMPSTTGNTLIWSDLATATAPVYPTITSTATSYPLANGSLTNCFEMFENTFGAIWCYEAASLFGIGVADFIRWNPSVLNGDNYTIYNCNLQNETQYCGSFYNQSLVPSTNQGYAPVPTSITANATTECLDWYELESGDTCDSVCQEFDIPFSSFYEWNPAIGSDCTNLWVESSYCVLGPGWQTVSYNMTTTTATGTNTAASTTTTATTGAPAPTQSGIVANCLKWYVAQSGDGCAAIATSYNITLDQFYAWNPAVGDDCSGLDADDAYCVDAPTTITSTTATTTTTSTAPSTTSVTPPGPTQSGIPTNCDAYAVVQSGDGCQTFADDNGITLADLYEWNPVLDNDCENFWADEAYCIGVSS